PPAPAPPAAPAAPAPSPALFGQQPTPQAQPTPPTFSQEYVHELREEAKTTRIAHQELETKHQAAETARQEAETKLAEAQAELAKFTREKAISSAAAGIANPALLLDSASFLQAIAEVSLDDPEAVKAAITTFVEQNSAYKPTPTLPGNSGPAPLGGSGQKPNTLEARAGCTTSASEQHIAANESSSSSTTTTSPSYTSIPEKSSPPTRSTPGDGWPRVSKTPCCLSAI
ncbi:MAG: hypothetical protein KDB25_08775, partial [Leucobacter sp.]|nr:hypothetical protein [Leucobacter sp.]